MMHWYLFPFSLIYGLVVSIRNKFFDWGWIESKNFDIPIINIGNISVGGTGKTPHVEYLLRMLRNYSTAIISRGYGRKTKGFIEVKTQSKATDVGDEPLQIKQKFPETKVIVDEKRVHAIESLIASSNIPDVILLDDAYQHRYVTPGLNILLIDYNRPINKDFILPVGRLREPAQNSHRANIVVVTKCPDTLTSTDMVNKQKELTIFDDQSLFFSTFKYGKLKHVFTLNTIYKRINDLNNISVLVVTGIANPKPMYNKLEKIGAKISKLAFSDHHDFTPSDINKIVNGYTAIKDKNKIIVCTEKDAVRLKEYKQSDISKLPIFYLSIEVMFLNNGIFSFDNKVINFLSNNQPD